MMWSTNSFQGAQRHPSRAPISTKRLIILTSIALAALVSVFAITLIHGNRFMVSWACFGCGLLGGFVSIQQRLKKVGDEELDLLAQSWFQILLIPVYGGIFVFGHSFPKPIQPVVDVAKLIFWCFVAGFSERFVPQIIERTQQDSDRESK